MPAVPGAYSGSGPTCFDRMKMGFALGFCVGMASGALFGGFSALRLGFILMFYLKNHFSFRIELIFF